MEIKFRMWIEKNGEHVIGKGGARILRAIEEGGSISAASKSLGMSYRYVWGYIRRMEKTVGKVVSSSKGGSRGGRSALTDNGKGIVEFYEFYENLMTKLTSGDFVRGKVEKGKIFPEKELEDGEVIILKV